MRRAARTDANHTEIVKAIKSCGFVVHDTSAVGGGFPDLTAWRATHGVVLIEVKDGNKPPSKRTLTPDQIKFARQFPVTVITSVSDVIKFAAQFDIPRKDIGAKL